MIARARAAPAWTITAAASVVYLILAPASPDLAAADYRSDLFARAGLTLWDNSWYGGHHLLAYSLLAPALGHWLGPRLLAALSMTAAVAVFPALAGERFDRRRTRIASLWLAVGASVSLLSSRVPFDLGLALGFAALALAQRRRPAGAALLTILCSLASPVAGAFLALAYVTWALVGGQRAARAGDPTVGKRAERPQPAESPSPVRRRLPAALLALLALTPIAALALVFPEGGTQPFVASAFYPALAGVLAIAALTPARRRMLRAGMLLYALALIGSYVLATAVGGNVDRLGALMAGPVAALALTGGAWRTRALIVLAPALLYWQVNAPIADFAAAVDDPAVQQSFYRPLLGELKALHVGYGAAPARIEVVPGVAHWEARWVAPHAMLARGWERQLDRYRNAIFYEGRLTSERYERWLRAQGVSYVALSDAPLDYSAKAEARLVDEGATYLREVWRSAHWRLYAVRDPRPLAQPPAQLTSVGTDGFALRVPAPGSYTVLIHFTPYWRVRGGCVAEAPGDWTRLQARRAGVLAATIDFSLSRLLSQGRRCG